MFFISRVLSVCVLIKSELFKLLQLDQSKDFEERRMIRAALRDLRKKNRGNCMCLSAFTKSVLFFKYFYDQRTQHVHKMSIIIVTNVKKVSLLSVLPSEAMLGCTQEELGKTGGVRCTLMIDSCLVWFCWLHPLLFVKCD